MKLQIGRKIVPARSLARGNEFTLCRNDDLDRNDLSIYLEYYIKFCEETTGNESA